MTKDASFRKQCGRPKYWPCFSRVLIGLPTVDSRPLRVNLTGSPWRCNQLRVALRSKRRDCLSFEDFIYVLSNRLFVPKIRFSGDGSVSLRG
jgi:hypothetical protein